MRVKLWGVRGSLPSPIDPQDLKMRTRQALEGFFDNGYSQKTELEKYLGELPIHIYGGYGGNTPCVEVTHGEDRLIIDAGSGVRHLGYEMMMGPCGRGLGEVHLLFTHFHWDHLIGLPFFAPIFVPGNKIHVHAVQDDLERVFRTIFSKPYFPVPIEALPSKIQFHKLEPRKAVEFGKISVTPYQLDHPDPCWGYRFEAAGKSYSHCVDTECTRVTRVELGPDLPLYQNVDLMVFDAQYTLMETMEKLNWGHATASLGLDLALREGIKQILFMHHDPASSDEKIASVVTQTRKYYQSQIKALKRDPSAVQWGFAVEGQVIDL